MKTKLFLILLLLAGMSGKLFAQHDLDVVNNLPCPVDIYYDVDDGTTCHTGAGPFSVGGATTITLVNGFNPGWVYMAQVAVGSAIAPVYDCPASCTIGGGLPACPFLSNTVGGIVVSAGCGTTTANISFTPATPGSNAVITIW